MRWLLYGTMTPAVSDALKRHEQQVGTLPELGCDPAAAPADILTAAQQKQWDVLTTDAALATAPFEQRLRFARTIVYLRLEAGDVEQDDAIDRLFDRYKRLSPGRLYTVTPRRVKIRQLPA